jgi:chromosome segregation ATPase
MSDEELEASLDIMRSANAERDAQIAALRAEVQSLRDERDLKALDYESRAKLVDAQLEIAALTRELEQLRAAAWELIAPYQDGDGFLVPPLYRRLAAALARHPEEPK